jgi:hypothetical protein
VILRNSVLALPAEHLSWRKPLPGGRLLLFHVNGRTATAQLGWCLRVGSFTP